jgi:hypothetical protein
MKNKLLYIIALLLTVLLCLSFELLKQFEMEAAKQIATLTAENTTLRQNIATLQDTADKQAQKIEQLKQEIAQLKPIEQKANRGETPVRYSLTEAERDLIERVVMAESGGESYKGQMLVAQCILNACEIDCIRPAKVVKKYAYAKARPEPSDSVKRAVSAVFDKGEQVTDEPIVYFYAPRIVKSEFHESQIFCVEEGGHRFFAER